MQDAKQKAMEKRRQGQSYFQKSNYDAAIIKFSEGILLLPQLGIYAKEMEQFYWQRAECHRRKVFFCCIITNCIVLLVNKLGLVLQKLINANQRLTFSVIIGQRVHFSKCLISL